MIKLNRLLLPVFTVIFFSACANQSVNLDGGNSSKNSDSKKTIKDTVELKTPPSYKNFKVQSDFKSRYEIVDNVSSRAKHVGFSKDQKQSIYRAKSKLSDLYREAAETGFSESQYLYAYGLYRGVFTLEKDYAGALFWANKAVKKDNHYAMSLLGDIYQFSPKHKNLKKSFFWREKAATYGNSEAIQNLGLMYQNGLGIRKDFNKAFLLYKLSIASGYGPAKRILGLWYIKNGEKSKAAELVNAPKEKKTYIGSNPKEMLIWSKKLAETGDPVFMYRYAVSLNRKKQIRESIVWAKKSAEADISNAMYYLGLIYQSSVTSFKNLKLAKEYYQQASDLGFPKAKTNLGGMYYRGEGTEKNHQKAFDLYVDAIETGRVDQNLAARRNLGTMFNKYGTSLYHKELSLRILQDTLVVLKRKKAQKK